MTLSDKLHLFYFDMLLTYMLFTDACKTEFGAMLCQGKDFENLKPVAITS